MLLLLVSLAAVDGAVFLSVILVYISELQLGEHTIWPPAALIMFSYITAVAVVCLAPFEAKLCVPACALNSL